MLFASMFSQNCPLCFILVGVHSIVIVNAVCIYIYAFIQSDLQCIQAIHVLSVDARVRDAVRVPL